MAVSQRHKIALDDMIRRDAEETYHKGVYEEITSTLLFIIWMENV